MGDYRELGGRRFRIIGRSAEAESFTTTPIVFMDFGNAQSLLEQLSGQTTYVLVKVAKGYDPKEVAARSASHVPVQRRPHPRRVGGGLARLLDRVDRPRHEHGRHGVPRHPGRRGDRGPDPLHLGGREHPQFGTVKAIGGSNWDIYKILGEQALIAAVCGFGLGAGASYAVRPAMASLHLTVLLTPQFSGVVFVGTVAMCLAAALFSFRRVALIDPALVFRG